MREGDTPLIDAARHGRVDDATALLADGADVNEPKTDGGGATALFIACQESHDAVVVTLIAANADVNQGVVDEKKFYSPLAIASTNGDVDIVKALVAANAKLSHDDRQRRVTRLPK